jgi:hypothetical protein
VSNIVLVRLEMELASVENRCTVCVKRTIGSEIILDTPMVLRGDEAQVEARFGPSVDSANPNVPQARKSFLTHPMVLLGEVGHVETSVGRLEMELVSEQDRCTVSSKVPRIRNHFGRTQWYS